jgi:hypothetical protein
MINERIFMCFINYQKAFCNIWYNQLISILQETGIDRHPNNLLIVLEPNKFNEKSSN